MQESGAERATVFLSWCPADEAWAIRLRNHLELLAREHGYDVWDDTRLGAGDDRTAGIEQAIGRARVAILLISADYLTAQAASLARLRDAADTRSLRLVPVIVRACAWEHVTWLARLEARPRDGRPLSARTAEGEIEVALTAIAEETDALVHGGENATKAQPPAARRRRVPRLSLALAAVLIGAGFAGRAWQRRTNPEPIPCGRPAGTLYEAEAAQLSGSATFDTEHQGYSGAGFVSGYGDSVPGTATSFTVNVPSDGSYAVVLCYANGASSDRSLSLHVNQQPPRRVILPAGKRWNNWQLTTESVVLHRGSNALAYRKDPGDRGAVNLDFIAVNAAATPD